ncbi:Asp-tRNA(Asn)/Glu-tRNA(Gln) amidotransferase subunit GatA [Candidatus Dependentiae bacterium]|nr:MAG: Asp-tRNA(Asn)/Glu-tRNA(Gln) amidotransferase subunit GatA [Candidatus Dependentiae bacterium]
MNPFSYSSITEIKKALESKKISLQELFALFKCHAQVANSKVDALLELFPYEEQEYNANNPLSGIPGIIKDNICIKDKVSSCSSKILQNFKAPYDATVISRLKAAGAQLLGRANMDEFAMGSSTETSAFLKTKNPWDTNRVPGGSSGGSAAAVATGMAPWALGTETGGSVRQPAAFCNLVGYKPTYGLISRYGLIAYGSSLDQIGIFARSVEDTALILSTLAGQDSNDSSSLPIEPKNYANHLSGFSIKGLRIGLVENALSAEGMDAEVTQAIYEAKKVYEQLGAHVSSISLPTLDYGAAAYFIISRAEAASNLARFDGIRYGMRSEATNLSDLYQKTRHDGFGPEVRKRIMVGNYVLSAGHAGQFYENAKRAVRLMRHEILETFKNTVDIIMMPTCSMPAFRFNAFDGNKLQMDLQDYFTCPANLIGIPAVSIQAGFTKTQLPIGLQLMAKHLDDQLLLQVAHAYQQVTDWHTKTPTGY